MKNNFAMSQFFLKLILFDPEISLSKIYSINIPIYMNRDFLFDQILKQKILETNNHLSNNMELTK